MITAISKNPVSMEIKKSQFIGMAFEVKNDTEVELVLKQLHALHPKATHICYAYRLPEQDRAFDDKEPAKTAGYPILNALKSAQVQCCLLTVVRYFGGIQLGTGGLVRAYGRCAKNTLDQADKKELERGNLVELTLSYDNYQTHLPMLNQLQVTQTLFREKVMILLACNDVELKNLLPLQPVVKEKNIWIER